MRTVNKGELTPNDLIFAEALINGSQQIDAFKQAFPEKSGWTYQSMATEASRLARSPKIVNEMKRLRSEVQKATQLTLEDKIEWLENIISDDTVATKDRIKSLALHNQMLGHNAPTKIENSGSVTLNVESRIAEAVDSLFKK